MKPAGQTRRGAGSWQGVLGWAAPFVLACVLTLTGALAPLENLLIDTRFRLLDRAPTGNVVLVQIDPQSLKAEKAWPWSRARYAVAVENLKRAGARNIAFDVDFSSQSDESGDAEFARVLEAWPGEIILARFSQGNAAARRRRTLVETAPAARFLKSAIVASANLETEASGVVRRGYYGALLPDGYRASIASVLAARPPSAARTFFIDYAIDPYEIPRLSFSDVLANRFDSRIVAGRQVLIGASAIELGDEFVVPRYGLLPGVWLHALSYESIVQGRALSRTSPLISLGLALLAAVALGRPARRWTWSGQVPRAAIFAASLVVPIAAQALSPLLIDTAPLLVVQVACFSMHVFGEFEERAKRILLQRRSISRHQALMATVVKRSSDGILVLDAEGRLQSCNPRAGELLGLDVSAAIGKQLAAALPGFAAPWQQSHGPPDGREGARWAFQAKFRDTDLEVLCERVEDADGGSHAGGARFIHVVWLRDITARKRLEAAEKAALEAARESSLAKTQLIANMSHELRTPLNAVIGFSDLFIRQIFGPLAERYLTYAQDIRDSGQRLLAVVNDVLEIAHLDSGRVALSRGEVSLPHLAQSCIDHVAQGPTGAGKSFRVEIPHGFPSLCADARLLRQALMHLLSNAVKFTGPDGKIEVVAGVLAGGHVTITVQDDGIGVDKQHFARLTEAFYQVDARLVRKYEGTGLGLYLVKRYMDLHGGTVEFESEPGRGLAVRLTFPQAAVPEPLRAAAG